MESRLTSTKFLFVIFQLSYQNVTGMSHRAFGDKREVPFSIVSLLKR